MTMISFRLNENELALLATKAGEGESLSLAAKRLLLESLGVAKRDDIPKDIYSIVRELIADSIKEGEIGKAIDKCYQSLVGHVEDIKLKAGIIEVVTPVDNCKQSVDIPEVVAPVDTCKQSVDIPEVVATVDTCKQEENKSQLINLLGLDDILSGDLYNADSLKKEGYFKAIADNKAEIKKISGIEVKLAHDLTDINTLIKWLGYKSTRTTKNKVSYSKVVGKIEP